MSDQGAALAQINQLLQSLVQGQGAAGAQNPGTAGAQGQGAAGAQGQGAGEAHADYTPRDRLQAMMLRAYIDEDYANSLKADPVAALQQVGLSNSQARELVQQPRDLGPTEALARGQCFDTTCMVSICPASCVASIPAIPGVCTESASTNPITQVATSVLGGIFGGF